MTKKIIGGAALSLFGLAFIFLGIMFVMASGEKMSRLGTGIILLIFGLTFLIFGIRLFRAGIAVSPSKIKERILKLAARNHGELPEDVLTGEIGKSDILDFALQSMINSGMAGKTLRKGRTFYLFSEFNMTLVVKQCPYCGNDYPVRDDIEACSSCGGDLKISVEKMRGKSDSYSMD
jgi:hypothetical protein